MHLKKVHLAEICSVKSALVYLAQNRLQTTRMWFEATRPSEKFNVKANESQKENDIKLS